MVARMAGIKCAGAGPRGSGAARAAIVPGGGPEAEPVAQHGHQVLEFVEELDESFHGAVSDRSNGVAGRNR